MTLDEIVLKREDIVEILADNLKKRHQFDNATDTLGHKIWEQRNFANCFVLTKLGLGIEHEELDTYNKQKEVIQYELNFGDTPEVYDNPQSVFYKGKQVLIPSGYDLGFYR